MQKIYLITGACGHLGRHIVERLLAAGARVRGLVAPLEEDRFLAPDLAALKVAVLDGSVAAAAAAAAGLDV